MSERHQVVVGNVGTVYDGSDSATASATFDQYWEASQTSPGARAYGESVVWLVGGEVYKERYPEDVDDGEIDLEDPRITPDGTEFQPKGWESV